jgi:hypothetical protein
LRSQQQQQQQQQLQQNAAKKKSLQKSLTLLSRTSLLPFARGACDLLREVLKTIFNKL